MSLCVRQLSLVLMLVLMSAAAPLPAAAPDWTAFDRVLDRHVHTHAADGSTWVDYRTLRSDPDYMRAVLLAGEARLPAEASRDERLAHYINAYNLLAIKVVVDNWPIGSVRDAGSILRPVWKRPAGRLGGRTVTLDHVEHEKLRPLGDPRMHFAIVCASRSCPDLRREAYSASRLNAQLDDQVRRFLANSRKGLDLRPGTVRASRIFDWFEEDFSISGGPLEFIRQYRPDIPVGSRFEADMVYDWAINGPPSAAPGS